MANRPARTTPTTVDPDNVPETLCDGQFNLSIAGQLATLTFNHWRPDATQLFRDGTIVPSAIVRARIVLTLSNLVALRDFLTANVNTAENTAESPAPATGGATKH
jgi:hypothetical protein